MANPATNRRETRSGGRKGGRRFLVVVALVLGGTLSAGASGARPDAEHPLPVTVSEDDGLYSVSAQFQVPEPATIALAVITDYEQIPRFMPDVKASVVRGRVPGGVVVEQEAVARMLMFSKRIHLLLVVRAEGDTVTFHDSSGRSFSCYEGAWRLASSNGHTVITYQLSARPSFDVPRFLLSRLLKRDARQMIERLRTEIASRSRQVANRQ